MPCLCLRRWAVPIRCPAPGLFPGGPTDGQRLCHRSRPVPLRCSPLPERGPSTALLGARQLAWSLAAGFAPGMPAELSQASRAGRWPLDRAREGRLSTRDESLPRASPCAAGRPRREAAAVTDDFDISRRPSPSPSPRAGQAAIPRRSASLPNRGELTGYRVGSAARRADPDATIARGEPAPARSLAVAT